MEPAWHALCGVVMLVGSLREVDRSLGGSRPETNAERRARCMPKLPERCLQDIGLTGGRMSASTRASSRGSMNGAHQPRADRLQRVLTGLVRRAAAAVHQSQAPSAEGAADDVETGNEGSQAETAARSSHSATRAGQSGDASQSAFSMPPSADAHDSMAPAKDVALHATATSTGHVSESGVHEAEQPAAMQVSRTINSDNIPIVSPSARRIVQQLLEGTGGAVATAAELAAAVHGSNARITGRRSPARQPPSAAATSTALEIPCSDTEAGVGSSRGHGQGQGQGQPRTLFPQASAHFKGNQHRFEASSGQQQSSGLDQPAAAAEQTAMNPSSLYAQQTPAAHGNLPGSPRMSKLAMPGAGPDHDAHITGQPASSSADIRASNNHPRPQGRQRLGAYSSRSRGDLAQRVLQNVEGFVRANESLLPCLQMPSSMALASATERAVRQLAAKNLLPDPEASLQGKHHQSRMLQRLEVRFCPCMSCWSSFQQQTSVVQQKQTQVLDPPPETIR